MGLGRGIRLVESNYFQGHLDINGAATVGVVGGDDSGWTDAVVVEESPEGKLEEGVFALRVAGVQPAALLRRVFAGVVVAGIGVTVIALRLNRIEVGRVRLVTDHRHVR